MAEKKIELILHRTFYPLPETRDFIARVCGQMDFESKEIYFIKTALDEACTNIVRHAFRKKAGSIKIRVLDDGEKVTLSVIDDGEPFPYHNAPRRTPGELVAQAAEGGLGLSLIERLMDDVRYIRRRHGNELRMVKYHERNGRT